MEPEPTVIPTSTPSAVPTPDIKTVAIGGAEADTDGIAVKVLGHNENSRNIICAAYDSGGVLLDIAFENLPPFDTETKIKFPIKYENAAMFNIMIWDNVENIRPLCENFTLEKNKLTI